MKKISIIMPVYNRQNFLHGSLTSVIRQTYENWELILVDDGSEDNSIEIINDFAKKLPERFTLVNSKGKKSGAGKCRNLGLKMATGDYIIFLDSDDLLEVFCLEQRLRVMENEPSFDWAVFLQYALTDEAIKPYHIFNKRVETKEEAIAAFLKMTPPWQTMAPMWKRQALLTLGGFDELFYYLEDPDLHLRALLNNELKVKFVNGLPADCFYRVSNIDPIKADSFYHNTIVGSYIFLNKVLNILPASYSHIKNGRYNADIRFGFFRFIRAFVLGRFKEYVREFDKFVALMDGARILTLGDKVKLRITKIAFNSNSKFVSFFRIKGVIFEVLYRNYM